MHDVDYTHREDLCPRATMQLGAGTNDGIDGVAQAVLEVK